MGRASARDKETKGRKHGTTAEEESAKTIQATDKTNKKGKGIKEKVSANVPAVLPSAARRAGTGKQRKDDRINETAAEEEEAATAIQVKFSEDTEHKEKQEKAPSNQAEKADAAKHKQFSKKK